MTQIEKARFTGRMIAGGLLILVGVLFTLDSFGFLDAGHLFEYWPLILIGIGLTRLIQAPTPSDRTPGWVLIAIGAAFLLFTLDFFEMYRVWPLALLAAGAFLVWQSARRRRPAFPEAASPDASGDSSFTGATGGLFVSSSEGEGSGERLNEFALMGGGERVVRSQNFRGGDVTAIMGGYEIDLRPAQIAGDTAKLDIFTLWGGVEIRVPEDWAVETQGMPILGGFTNSARGVPGEAPKKRFVVTGVAIMGGVEIKN
jgi:hypothetical protein